MPQYSHIRLIFSIFMLLLGWVSSAVAAPALPVERELVQPDGSRFTGRLVGDEWNHGIETGRGYAVARDADGWWRYVSGYQGREPSLNATPAHLSPPADVQPSVSLDTRTAFSPPQPIVSAPMTRAVPSDGRFNGHVLYLLVDFTDVSASTTEADWSSFVSDELVRYFQVNSHGKAQLQPALETFGGFNNGVVGWLRMPYAHPRANDLSNILDAWAMHSLVRDAILAADPYVDFAQYDRNGDGMVGSTELAVVVVAAGGEAAAYDTVSIWGHAWSIIYSPVPVVDGVRVGSGGDGQHGYAAFGEMHGDHQATLGIMAHELGHLIFDLPDLYDTNPVPTESSGIGAFGLMGSGSWGFSFDDSYQGETPVMLSAWSRYTLGWTNPKNPLGRMAVTAASSPNATADNSALLAESGRAGEYFLIENRQPIDYDRGLERMLGHSFGGFAIWHVDESQPDNSDESHRMVDLEEADSHPMGTTVGSYTDLWFAGNTVSPGAFGPTTNPSSRRYDRVDSEVALQGFSSAAEVMTLEAAGFNQPPTAVDDLVATAEDTALNITDVTANDVDREGNLLTVVATADEVFSSLEGGQVSYLGDGAFRYQPPAHFNGEDRFGYLVSDGENVAEGAVVITVRAVNDAPLLPNRNFELAEDGVLTDLWLLAGVVDIEGDPVRLLAVDAVSAQGGSVTGLDNGSFEYRPVADFHGKDSFSYRVDDGRDESVGVVNISVTPINDAPDAKDDSAATDEDVAIEIDLLANDRDVDGDALVLLTLDLTSSAGGSIQQLSQSAVSYTPPENFFGDDSFSYIISDGQGGVASALVRIAVSSVNDPPQPLDDRFETKEDTPLTLPNSVLDNDRDIDGDALSIASFDNPSAAGGQLLHLGDGQFSYTPPAGFSGEDRFTYTVSDGAGAQATAQVLITVSAVNDAPVAGIDRFSTEEDTALTLSGLLDNDSDVDGDPISLLGIDPQSENGGLVVELDNGSFSYTPTANFHGEDRIGYRIGDGRGGEAAGEILITVLPLNDQPEAVEDQFETDEDTPLVLTELLSNDTDVDGDALTLLAVDAASTAGGAVVQLGGGQFQYTPAADFHGEDDLSYQISDGAGGEATGYIRLLVRSVNDAPIPGADQAQTSYPQPVDIAVLQNDVDADGDALALASFDTRSVAGGSVSDLGAGLLRYSPVADFAGEDRFNYTVRDPSGAEATATVQVQVLPGRQLGLPTITPPGGRSHEPISVTVSCASAEPGSEIRYTLDGSDPGGNAGASLACGGGLLIEQSAELRVVAVLDGWRDSSLAKASFEIDPLLDSDGDGMPDAWELANGLDPHSAADAVVDSDGDGLNNLEEYQAQLNPAVDDVPPELISPADVAMDASGWYTDVAIGVALASDAVDGVLTATADRQGPFLPGRHEIRWRATDSAGNSAEAVQRVEVRPLVLLGVDRMASEGSQVSLPVELSGDAPNYPVTLHYRLSGTADGGDHDLRDGVLQIVSGRSATLNFSVHRNDPAGEPDETLVLSFYDAEGAVLTAHRQLMVTLVERNLAPRARLSLWQDGLPVASPASSGGAIEVRTDAIDPEGGAVSLDWTGSTHHLVQHGRSDGSKWVVGEPSSLLAAGENYEHEAVAVISDSAEPAASLRQSLSFRLSPGAATLDLDGDGIDDAVDPLIEPYWLQLEASSAVPLPRIATSAGLQLRVGRVAALSGRAGARVSMDDIHLVSNGGARESDPIAVHDDGYAHGSDLFDLQIGGLDQPGDTVALVVPLSQPMGINSEVRLLSSNRGPWKSFAAGNGESLAAAAVDVSCPAPPSEGFDEVLAGASCLKLVVRDGGEHDADHAANGQISLLLSVATREDSPPQDSPSGSGGGGALSWWLLAGLLLLRRKVALSRVQSRSA